RFPALVPRYRALYSSSAYVPPAFARTVEARFARLAGANGLVGRRRADRPDAQGPPARQLALVW
ncbi:MAG: radical SAM protein, partial [Candidatus Rokuibacteriota bacterium]